MFRKKIVAWIMLGTFASANAHVVGHNQIEHAGVHQEVTEIVGNFEQVEKYIEENTVPFQDFSKATEKVDVQNIKSDEKIAVNVDVSNHYAPHYQPTGIRQSADQLKLQIEQGIIKQSKHVRDSVVHRMERKLKALGMPGTSIRNMEDYTLDYRVKAVHIIVTGYASPEGDIHKNNELSIRRSRQIAEFIGELEFTAFDELGIQDSVRPNFTTRGGGILTDHPAVMKAVQILNNYVQSNRIIIDGKIPLINYHRLNKHRESEIKKFSDILRYARKHSGSVTQMVEDLLNQVRITRTTVIVEIEADAYVVVVTLIEKRTETPLKPESPKITKVHIIEERKKLKHIVEKKIGRAIPKQIQRDYNLRKNRPRSINQTYNKL